MKNSSINLIEILELLKSNPEVEPEEILFLLDSFYKCPIDDKGERQGPLVGYAGTYGLDAKHFVGDIYLNFAPVEEYYFIIKHLAKRLYNMLPKRNVFEVDAYCGAPEGGKALALALSSFSLESRYIYPDIVTTSVATSEGRAERKLVWGRHQVNPGEKVAIVEDLNNNFSTTNELIELIHIAKAEVVAIMSFYNRSLLVTGDTYTYKGLVDHYCKTIEIPIITLKTNPIEQYKQDESFVAEDVQKGNVVWKPKLGWVNLKAAMEAHKKK